MKIEIDDRFDQPHNSLLIVVIEGDPDSIRAALKNILDSPGKPVQGVHIRSDDTTQIITPVWNGKKY